MSQFKARYKQIYSIASAAAGAPPKSMEDSDWDMSDDDEGGGDSEKPWLTKFNRYLNMHDVLPEGMTVVKWWGVCNILFFLNLLVAYTHSFF